MPDLTLAFRTARVMYGTMLWVSELTMRERVKMGLNVSDKNVVNELVFEHMRTEVCTNFCGRLLHRWRRTAWSGLSGAAKLVSLFFR